MNNWEDEGMKGQMNKTEDERINESLITWGGRVLGSSIPFSLRFISLQATENSLKSIFPSPFISDKPLHRKYKIINWSYLKTSQKDNHETSINDRVSEREYLHFFVLFYLCTYFLFYLIWEYMFAIFVFFRTKLYGI